MTTASFTSANNATVKRWSERIMREAFYTNPLSAFMGTSDSAIIQIQTDLDRLSGDRVRVQMTPNLDPTTAYISGDGSLSGNEQAIDIYTQDLTVDTLKVGVLVSEFDISQQRVNLNLKQEIYEKLRRVDVEKMRNDLLVALTDTSAGRTQARYLYGNKESNWDATHATAEGNVTSDDKVTLETIRLAAHKAKYKGLRKMNPAKVAAMGPNGEAFPVEGFVALLQPLCARDLKADPNYKNQIVYNDRLKATDAVFNGAFYLGTFEGVHIFEMPDPDDKLLVSGVGSGSIDLGHNLLLGAQAAIVAMPMMPQFRLKAEDDYKTKFGVGLIQIRGQDKTVFDSEDWGCVHFFNAAEADA